MWECRVEIEIAAPVMSVYERLRDLTRHAEFAEGLAAVRQTAPGEAVVGARYRAEERIPGKYVSEAELTQLVKPSLIAWRAWVPHVMRTEWELQLAPAPIGTRLLQVSRWQATGPVGFVMLNLHRKRHVPEENLRTLKQIKSILETDVGRLAAGRPA